jgi:NAD(P)-dependent dehydrogenase (short-subunit alcohol dehydrogenase family)
MLTGRVALVTGSARRLGRAIALGLADLGADVAVHYRGSREEAEATGLKAFQADVTDPEECRRLVAEVVAHFGKLDILVNNVGDYHQASLLEESIEAWRYMLDSNLNSTFYMCHHALPILRQQDYARIINIGFAGTPASTQTTAYTIAKQGVKTLTQALAKAVGSEPMTVNMVSPGTIEGAVAAPQLARVPRGRWAREEEIVGAIAYLLSPEADYVTGQDLQVAGGWGL